MKNEDAVAAVVALMLLLAVIVTFLSLYATTYLPALKQQAEIQQIAGVKEAFMRFDNDIEHVISDKVGVSYGETIRLGGGDIVLSQEKTSGTVSVTKDSGLFVITGTNVTGGILRQVSDTSVVRFDPAFSFWEKQGYSWQDGYLNVTHGNRSTPLSFFTMDDVVSGYLPGYAAGLLTFSGSAYDTNPAYLRDLEVTVVTIVPGSVPGEDRNEASGNGACVLRINASSSTEYLNDLHTSGSLVVEIKNSPLRTALAGHTATEMDALASRYPMTFTSPVEEVQGTDTDVYTLPVAADSSHPVSLTIRAVTIAVYVR